MTECKPASECGRWGGREAGSLGVGDFVQCARAQPHVLLRTQRACAQLLLHDVTSCADAQLPLCACALPQERATFRAALLLACLRVLVYLQ